MADFTNKYPYTDFHELNLDWFLEEFKKIADKEAALEVTVQQFIDFVNSYFENLDVQEEINNKLNQMQADGSLAQIIQPLFNTYTTQVNNIINQQNLTIATAIGDQNQHIDDQDADIATLVARMDEFASLPPGSTSGNAELLDIRVQADGTTAASAGDAVRAQITEITNLAWKPSDIFINSAATLSTYPNANTFPVQKIILVNSSYASQVQNSPYTNKAYFIIASGFSMHPGQIPYGGEIQIATPAFTSEASMKIRCHDGSNWSAWKEISGGVNLGEVLHSTGAYINSAAALALRPDCDTIDYNEMILVSAAYASQIAHSPFTNTAFTLISTGFSYSNNPVPYGGEIQFAVPMFESIPSGMFKYRYYDGNDWSSWINLGGCEIYADPTNWIEKLDEAIELNGATLYLSSGTYNCFDGTHDEAYWIAKRPATRYCGNILKNGVKLIGKGRVVINARYTGSDPDIMENFSAFNIAGDCEIRNINIEAQNICYCVHDDSPIVTTDNTLAKFENVNMNHYGTTHTFLYGAPICIGGGTNYYIGREIRDCVFYAASNTKPVNYHTSTNGNGDVIMTGCIFKNGSIGFNAYGSAGTLTAKITGNKFQQDIQGRSTTGLTLYDWGNVI